MSSENETACPARGLHLGTLCTSKEAVLAENNTEGSVQTTYTALRVASWVALLTIAIAIVYASAQAIINWNVISV